MTTVYTKQELQEMPDNDIQKLWNDLAMMFERIRTDRPQTATVGFFQLSSETERRGLQIGKDKLGKIILEPKGI